jgi:hypothetical protein
VQTRSVLPCLVQKRCKLAQLINLSGFPIINSQRLEVNMLHKSPSSHLFERSKSGLRVIGTSTEHAAPRVGDCDVVGEHSLPFGRRQTTQLPRRADLAPMSSSDLGEDEETYALT